MTVNIAIFGSANTPEQMHPEERSMAAELGSNFGKVFGSDIKLITGGCIGIPELVAKHAKQYGTKVAGFSGESSLQAHIDNPNYTDPANLDELYFIDEDEKILKGFTQRSLRMIEEADAGIFIGGRTGTMTEFGAMHDETNKPMYMLAGSIANFVNRFKHLKLNKPRNPEVYRTSSPFYLTSKIDKDFNIAHFENDPQYHIVDYTGATLGCGFRTQYATLAQDPAKVLHRR